jgi:hypothetical protein
MRILFTLPLAALLACGQSRSSTDCTTGTPCASGLVCNPTTRRCELSVTPSSTGGGFTGTGGGSSGTGGGQTGGGVTGGGSAGGTGGGTTADAGVPLATAWQLTLDMSPLNQPLRASCYANRPPPTSVPALPPVRLDVVLFSHPTASAIAIDPRAPSLVIGDAPRFDFPAAITNGVATGETTTFTGEQQVTSLGPVALSRNAIETRTNLAVFTVDRSSGRPSGTVAINARYFCGDNGPTTMNQCPRAAPFAADAAECDVTLAFTAQPIAMPAWALPQPAVPGAEAYALLLDSRFVDNALCYVSTRIPTARRSTSNLRSYHALQRVTVPSGPALEIDDLVAKLGDAPTVTVDLPLETFGSQFRMTRTVTSLGPVSRGRTANETRTTSASMPFAPAGGLAESELTLNAQYSCVASGGSPMQQCPAGNSTDPLAPDAVNCSVMWNYQAFRVR